MIMFKSTHKRVIENFTELLSLTNEEVIAAKNKVDKLEDANHELHQDFDNANKTIKELREIIKMLEKDKLELNFCNQEAKKEIKRLNTRVEVNIIAKNQLRDLCVYKNNEDRAVMAKNKILINEKVDSKKVWDLTMLIG